MKYQAKITKQSQFGILPILVHLGIAFIIAGIVWFGMNGGIPKIKFNMPAFFISKPRPTPLIPLREENIVDIATDESKIDFSEPLVLSSPTSYVLKNKYVPLTEPTAYQYPTIVPGQPGSKEWEEEFQRKWNEMNTKNALMQKQVEDSQKQFCQDHPNLCK